MAINKKDDDSFDIDGTSVPASMLKPETRASLVSQWQLQHPDVMESPSSPGMPASYQERMAALSGGGPVARNADGIPISGGAGAIPSDAQYKGADAGPGGTLPAAGPAQPSPTAEGKLGEEKPKGPIDFSQYTSQQAPPQIGLGAVGQQIHSKVLGKREEAELRTANQNMVTAQNELGQAEGDAAKKIADEQQRQVAEQQTQLQAMQEVEKARAAAQQQQFQKSQDAIDQVKNGAIDPDHFWKTKGTGSRIVGAIAMALGEFGAGLTGRQNGAMRIIDDAINRDIDAQKAQLMKARDVASLQNNQFAQLMQMGMSDRQAEATLRLQANQAAQQKLQAIVAGTQNPQVIARAKLAGAQLQQQQAAQMAELKSSVVETTKVPTVNGMPIAGKGAGEAVPPAQQSTVNDLDTAISGLQGMLSRLRTGKGPDASAPLSKYFGGSSASDWDKDRSLLLPAIAKANDITLSERNKDIVEDMLPSSSQAGVTTGSARRQLEQQLAMLIQKRKGMVQKLSGSGYRTAGLGQGPYAAQTFKPAE